MPLTEWSAKHNTWIKGCLNCNRVFIGKEDYEASLKIFAWVFTTRNDYTADGLHYVCRTCCVTRARLGSNAKSFNILKLYESQDGKCAICNKDIYLHGVNQRCTANIDHCHQTGTVRGLLCSGCNNIVAAIDSPLLENAMRYVNNNK